MILTRRELFERGAALATCGLVAPAYAQTSGRQAALTSQGTGPIELEIDSFPLVVNGRTGHGIAVNRSIPGPLLRLKEGQDAVIQVNNRLAEVTSIHWHGVILPADMDGVPGVSFAGIPARGTFIYRFPVRQSGTYWAHSHSGGQELLGFYFPLVIDPVEPEPFRYDRDYVVMLSDWSFEPPGQIIAKLKKQAGYYNFQKRTVADFLRDISRNGFVSTVRERASWSKMRMDPTDFADVTGYTYTYLLNGLTPEANWTGLFRTGERVRLRFIAAGAMTYFDVRIPGLKMTVVAVDGQNVRPVLIDEFRIGPGETYDVIVEPEDRAYTLFAEALDRSGYTRGTLAPQPGMTAPVPPRRRRPIRTMADMGMDMSGMEGGKSAVSSMPGMPGMEGAAARKKAAQTAGMDTSGHDMHGMEAADQALHRAKEQQSSGHAGHGAPATDHGRHALQGPSLPGSPPVMHGPDTHGSGNSMIAMASRNRLDDPGSGFEESDGKVLVYADLRSLTPPSDQREPTREVELHITGNMDRYMWSFDGKKYSETSAPIPFHYGERLRLILVNDTMMEHPIHLHGMWMELENTTSPDRPRKHTITVKPAERLSVAITADAPGRWALHCHLLLHMEMGMFRVVEVSGQAVSS